MKEKENGEIKREKVLFVDDEMNILKSLRRELCQAEFDVLIANSAMQGLEILNQEDVAVVISDIKMPNMDGLQFLRIVKEKYPDINRVILSGFVEQSTVVSSIIQGIATTYFAKPWDIEVLNNSIIHILMIRNMLGQKELLSVINSIQRLPTLPLLYKKLLSAIEQDLSLKKIAKIIDNDVSISTRILRVANSAFYGKMKISSVERAIIHLGLNIVKDIALTISIAGQEPLTYDRNRDVSNICLHSSLVNLAIREIYKRKYGKSIMEDFSSVGITHDIGKIILIQYFPERYKLIIGHQEKNEGKSFYQCELELGYEKNTHAEIGAYFLSLWNLPAINIEVAMFHHTPDRSADHFKDIVSIANLANELVTFLIQNRTIENLNFSTFECDLFSKEELGMIGNEIRSELNGKNSIE